jgi:Response regulators consisting of a CheY-like receiver domain and a winged-helix DNA-binding domain
MTENGTKIFVVDDEQQIVRVLKRALEAAGFAVQSALSAKNALDAIQLWTPDVVITDLAMPEINGIELCRKIREFSRVPIVVLSVKGDEQAKVQALDSGADDYVTKPFGMSELLARVRALHRRSERTTPQNSDEAFELGDFLIEPHLRRVQVRGKEVRLTPKEYDLLLYFASNSERVLTHRAILEAIWGANSSEQREYLRVFVGQLRKKIEKNPSVPKYIKTEPWIGYRFEPAS